MENLRRHLCLTFLAIVGGLALATGACDSLVDRDKRCHQRAQEAFGCCPFCSSECLIPEVARVDLGEDEGCSIGDLAEEPSDEADDADARPEDDAHDEFPGAPTAHP